MNDEDDDADSGQEISADTSQVSQVGQHFVCTTDLPCLRTCILGVYVHVCLRTSILGVYVHVCL